MISQLANGVALLGAALALAGIVQAALGWAAVRRFAAARPVPGPCPPISVLKPLYGDEPLLEAALASFCAQDYPGFQLVFGVQDPNDKALGVLARLRERFPAADVSIVIDPTPHGANRKIANLINMLPAARHDTLVIADSDMHVAPDYLCRIAAALAVPGTGLVTTLYTGRPAHAGLTGRLGAAYIAQVFSPGALLARRLGRQDCLGASMALTRQTLCRVGGLPALSPYVADDQVLGQLVRSLGLHVTLADTVPATTVPERQVGALLRHELRWARTIRAVAPTGFALSVVQFPLFWAALACLATPASAWVWAGFLASWALRAATGRDIERRLGGAAAPLWLPPLRDAMSVLVMALAYAGRDVAWRGTVLRTDTDTLFGAGKPSLPTASLAPPSLVHEGMIPP